MSTKKSEIQPLKVDDTMPKWFAFKTEKGVVFLDDVGSVLCDHKVPRDEYELWIKGDVQNSHCPMCDYSGELIGSILSTGSKGSVARFVSSSSTKLNDAYKKVDEEIYATGVWGRVNDTITKATLEFKKELKKKAGGTELYGEFVRHLYTLFLEGAALSVNEAYKLVDNQNFKALYELFKGSLNRANSLNENLKIGSSINDNIDMKEIQITLLQALGLDNAKSIFMKEYSDYVSKKKKDKLPDQETVKKQGTDLFNQFNTMKKMKNIDKKTTIELMVIYSTFVSLFANIVDLSKSYLGENAFKLIE